MSENLTQFDSGNTTFDRDFEFTVRARDFSGLSQEDKKFKITVSDQSQKSFSNVYVKAFMEKAKRLSWFDFITNIQTFPPEKIYRYGDSNFGIQTDLKVLIYAGIESVDAVKFVQAMSRNHYRKRFYFGDVKFALAKNDSQEIVYEIIYAEIKDEYFTGTKKISPVIELKDKINSPVLLSYDAITVDSDIPYASDKDHQRVFPNSVNNMRDRIETIGETDRDYLPLWMRSIQNQADFEPGYTLMLPICFAKPGESGNIISRINASNFDFKLINFEADRYIIDILDGVIEDKYLAFPQRREKEP